MSKIIGLLAFLIFCSILGATGEDQDSTKTELNGFGSLRYETNSLSHKIGFSFSGMLNKHIEVGGTFAGFNILEKDKYNRNRTNFSLSPFLEGVALIPIFYQYIDTKAFRVFISPLLIGNSSLSLYPFNPPNERLKNFKLKTNQLKRVSLSFYIKNNYDLFLFRRNNWIELSPGYGISLSVDDFSVKLGFERNHEFVKKHKTKHTDRIFFSAGWVGLLND